MAEYTIKVKVDSGDVAKQLRSAFQRTPMLAMGGGGIGGGPIGGQMAGEDKQFRKSVLQYYDLMNKKLEKTQKIQEKGWLGKFGPGLMKLAGITMGLAALRQVGKALIDSSPLLQAMTKIGSTAITLFLRPIGDFIGFLLRPLVLLMLKHGIKFYRLFGGFTAMKAAETLINRLAGVDEGGEPSGEIAITGAIGPGGQVARSILETIWTAIFGEGVTDEESAKAKIPGGGILGFLGGIGLFVTPTEEQKKERTEEKKKEARTKAEQDIYPWLQTSGEGECPFEVWTKFLGGEAAETSEEAELNMIDMSAQFGRIKDLADQAVREGAEPTTFNLRNIARLFVEGRRSGLSAKESMENIAITFKRSEQRIFDLLNSLAQQRNPDGGLSSAAVTARTIIAESGGDLLGGGEEIPEPQPKPEPKPDPQIAKDKAAIDAIIAFNRSNPSAPYCTIYPDVVAGYKAKYPCYRVNEYRSGGLITEPVAGIGLRSGQPYSFGEGGTERVTPVGGSSSGGGDVYSATFYITGVNPDEFESKVKPMVMQWLRDSKSNRGIL